MAQGQNKTTTVIVNNNPKVTVSKTTEHIVVNGTLQPDRIDSEPGVNSRFQ